MVAKMCTCKCCVGENEKILAAGKATVVVMDRPIIYVDKIYVNNSSCDQDKLRVERKSSRGLLQLVTRCVNAAIRVLEITGPVFVAVWTLVQLLG